MRHFYAYRHGGSRPVDFLRFDSRADRDAWVNAGLGRLPCRADAVPSGASKGLPWQAEEVLLPGREEPITIASYHPEERP